MTKIILKASHPGISYSDEKYDANQGAGPLNPLEVASAKGELATMRRGPATIDVQFLHLRDQKQQSTKIRAQILHSENRVLFTHPGFCKWYASCCRNMCTAPYHLGGDREWAAAAVLRAESAEINQFYYGSLH